MSSIPDGPPLVVGRDLTLGPRENLADRMWSVRKHPGECCAEVSRKGESQPCDKTAVAVALPDDGDGYHFWPVCAYHARGALLPLTELLELLKTEDA